MGGFLGRAKDLQAACAEDVDHAGSERRFRADHREMDLLLLREVGQFLRIGDVDVGQFVFVRRAGVARCNVDFLQTGRLGEMPRQRMFATAGTDDE